MIHHKENTFILRDRLVWDIKQDLVLLSDLLARGGVLFWCREGEWRAIGGPQLETVVGFLQRHEKLRQAYITADLACMAADRVHAYDEWEDALLVPAKLVRWLRDEAKQLCETNTTADSTTE